VFSVKQTLLIKLSRIPECLDRNGKSLSFKENECLHVNETSDVKHIDAGETKIEKTDKTYRTLL
jgi:hypothetical protein